MSRSMRHTPISGNCRVFSERWHKRRTNSRLRALNRQRLAQAAKRNDGDEGLPLPPVKPWHAVDPWNGAKDGKARFDPERWPEGMRK